MQIFLSVAYTVFLALNYNSTFREHHAETSEDEKGLINPFIISIHTISACNLLQPVNQKGPGVQAVPIPRKQCKIIEYEYQELKSSGLKAKFFPFLQAVTV